MGVLFAVLLSMPGAGLTNHLLRDRSDAGSIALAVAAGAVVGVVVLAAVGLVLLPWNKAFVATLIAQGGWEIIAFSVFGGPIATAVAVWRWRPRSRDAGDLRSV